MESRRPRRSRRNKLRSEKKTLKKKRKHQAILSNSDGDDGEEARWLNRADQADGQMNRKGNFENTRCSSRRPGQAQPKTNHPDLTDFY